MKKWLIATMAVLFVAPCILANEWGLGMKIGIGKNDPKGIKETINTAETLGYSGSLDKNPGFLGIETAYEKNLAEHDKLGIKLGLDWYLQNKGKLSTSGITVMEGKERTYAIPLTVYYKRDQGINNFSFYGGAGITFIQSDVEITYHPALGIDNENPHKNKFFPHILIGAEYRTSEVFALGLEAKYNINAKLKKHGEVLSDRSGLSAALTGRFYF